MGEKKRILFLYTELATYFLACVRHLVKTHTVDVHIVRWPLNNEAPFDFSDFQEGITMYDRKSFTDVELEQLVKTINPSVIYCSGWMDKTYMAICKKWKTKVNTIAGFDTQWTGSLKQYAHVVLSPFTLKRSFSHVWVAGEPQKKYAKRLGYAHNTILTGVYSADVPFFEKYFIRANECKAVKLPKRFIFVGRYLEFKGIFDLWEAFADTFNHLDHDWELWCLGTGDLWEKRMQHKAIQHMGFVQPAHMEKYILETAVFVLPSRFEPWAVALHEFCAAGFPVICSDKVGAATAFLQHEKNGFEFEAGNRKQLTQCMLNFIQMPQNQVLAMGNKSHELALSITPSTWSNSIMQCM